MFNRVGVDLNPRSVTHFICNIITKYFILFILILSYSFIIFRQNTQNLLTFTFQYFFCRITRVQQQYRLNKYLDATQWREHVFKMQMHLKNKQMIFKDILINTGILARQWFSSTAPAGTRPCRQTLQVRNDTGKSASIGTPAGCTGPVQCRSSVSTWV